MSKTSKIIVGILVILAIVFIGYRWHQTHTSVPTGTFKIGSFLPLSGDLASLGSEVNRGALIAVDELKAQGRDIQYVSEDDQFKATGSIQAASKLVTIDKMDAVFTSTVQEMKPVYPVFNSSKVPLLVTWDSNEFIKSAGDHVFSIGFSTEWAGELMATHAYQKLGLRQVAIIHHIDEWSYLISSAFQNKFTELGGTIVMREKTEPTVRDYRTLLIKAKNLNADGIYFPLLPPIKGVFVKQAKQLGIQATLMAADGYLQDEIHEGGAASEGVYFTNIYANQKDTLTKKYQARFHSAPTDAVFVSFGYDGVMMLEAANTLAKNKNVSLRDAMTLVDIQGTGSPIKMNGSQYSERLEKIYKITKETPVEIKQ